LVTNPFKNTFQVLQGTKMNLIESSLVHFTYQSTAPLVLSVENFTIGQDFNLNLNRMYINFTLDILAISKGSII